MSLDAQTAELERDCAERNWKVPFGKMTAPHPTQPKLKILVEHPDESGARAGQERE